jgi:hypothetical protein
VNKHALASTQIKREDLSSSHAARKTLKLIYPEHQFHVSVTSDCNVKRGKPGDFHRWCCSRWFMRRPRTAWQVVWMGNAQNTYRNLEGKPVSMWQFKRQILWTDNIKMCNRKTARHWSRCSVRWSQLTTYYYISLRFILKLYADLFWSFPSELFSSWFVTNLRMHIWSLTFALLSSIKHSVLICRLH